MGSGKYTAGNLMGGKEDASSNVTPTAEQTELNKLQLEQQRAIQPQAMELQKSAYDIGNLLLQGQGLPGYLSALPQGVQSQEIPYESSQLGEDYTNQLVQQSLRDIYPQFQKMGLPIESGVSQSIAGRTAGDIRRGVAENNIDRGLQTQQFNVQTNQTSQYQNLNNLLNLLNLAVGGQAQIQAPVINQGAQLGQRLAGLSSTTGTKQTNPFMTALSSSLGNSLGGGSYGSVW